MIFSPSIATLLAGAGVLKSMGWTEATFAVANATPSVTIAVTIYSGIQPSATTITNNWTNYNTNFLFHQPGLNITQPNFNNATTGGILPLSNVPTAVTASASGTASWAILWCSNIAAGTGAGQIGNAALPNANFIVGPVTTGSGNGMIILSSLSITSGNSVTTQSVNLVFSI